MLARAYFRLVDEIATAYTEAQLVALCDRIAVGEMHPLERRTLERQVRARERTLQLEIEGL